MSAGEDQAPIKQQVLDPTNRKLRILAAQGFVPLPPIELVPLQVVLASSDDTELAGLATASLEALKPTETVSLISDGIDGEALGFFAGHVKHAAVLEAILRRRDIRAELLIEMASSLDPDLQEVLLMRQDAIIGEPAILEALEKNPEISSYSERRIREYRDHLLPREKKPKTPDELEADALTEAELQAAMAEALEAPVGRGEVDESTGLSDSQIRTLSVPLRLKLTRGARPSLRNLLIRDPNPMVATSVLRNNPIADAEIERIASNRAVVHEVLETISQNRTWTRKYSVMLALVRNPRCSVGVAIRFLPRLAVRDLSQVARDRNVANAVRTAAQRIFKTKKN